MSVLRGSRGCPSAGSLSGKKAEVARSYIITRSPRADLLYPLQ